MSTPSVGGFGFGAARFAVSIASCVIGLPRSRGQLRSRHIRIRSRLR
ncbi:hypothetical protein LC55x_4458 [Lysobacter capsici]|nr:hypothetical protein LC55x_4458 [Lysobacter capsici]